MALCLPLCHKGVAQVGQNTGTRPEIPARFNRDTVQHLITEIDKPYNATILKVGYFMQRGKVELPQSEGVELLNVAIEAETVGSKKWFILQSLYGMASLRVPGASVQEGLNAYAAMFEHAIEAPRSGASYQLNQAISEFIFSVNGRLNALKMRSSLQTQEVMLKAWRAYVTTLSQRRQGDVVKEPDWYEAIVKSNSQSKFADPTDQALNDPAIPKTYGLLSAAAGVFTRDDPARAIDLLQQAEPFLPRSNHNEVARYYNRLVDLLSQNKEFSQAIDAQRKYTEQTGHGQAHLALLYYQHDYDEAGDSVLQSLMTDSASEHEINVLAKALQILASDTQYPHSEKMVERTISLLQNYLNMQRERTVEEELKARKTLGTLLIHQNRYHEASKVLDISHLKQPFLTLSAKSDAASIQRLLSASSIKIE